MPSPRIHSWRRAAAVALLPVNLFALAGITACSGGGGGGGAAAEEEDNGVVTEVTTSDVGSGRVEVQFTIQAPASKQIGIDLLFSTDRGQAYTTATMEGAPSDPASLPADPSGVRHTIFWAASVDLQVLPQHDLMVRVSPRDLETGSPGVPGESGIFGLGDNSAPSILGVAPPDGVRGGWIYLGYTVADAESDHVAIEGEFSIDGGSTFAPATLAGGDGAVSVETSPEGIFHTIAWNAQSDAPGTATSLARLRLRAIDIDVGAYASSASFPIDTRAPSVDLLTINSIPRVMNGSIPFTNTAGASQAFGLLAPDRDFLITISFLQGGPAIDPGSLAVTASSPLGGGEAAGGIDAGTDFGSLFTVDGGGASALLAVDEPIRFPAGVQTVTARISDSLGNVSDPASYTFAAEPAAPSQLPFDSPERWWLNFVRDNWTITTSVSGTGWVTITATGTANGTADFIEDLRILGLQSASAQAWINAVVLEAVKEAILGRLNELYGRNFDGSPSADGAAIEFSLSPPASPYSRIGIGGDDPIPGYTIGRAEYDYRNSERNDDGSSDLGIFTTNLIEFYINASYSFRSRFNPFIPGRGTPIGANPADAVVLAEGFVRSAPGNTAAQNARYDAIALAIDGISRSTATVLAHEIGHSVGLVANGAPPSGLFGGETLASFAGPYTSSYHLDGCENDIMASALSFAESLITGAGGPRFNELSLSYLLERILVD